MLIFLFFVFILYAVFVIAINRGYLRLPAECSQHIPLVTCIVAARNEQDNIQTCLQALLAQHYPGSRMQIIVVDDHSTDQTLQIAETTGRNKGRVLVCQSQFQPWRSRKKAALAHAIQFATGELLLLTDADCIPGPYWVKRMVERFTRNIGLVAGFSPQTARASLCNRILCIDSAAAAWVSAGTIGWQHGVTCTGRNLAVRRKALEDVGGYQAFPDTLSGDDDFLLHLVQKSNAWQTAYCLEPDSVVPAHGPENLLQFIRQKQRHLSSGTRYHAGAQFGYAIYHGLNYSLWLSGFIWPSYWWMMIVIFKLLIDFSILYNFLNQVDQQIRPVSFILWELFFPAYHLISAPAAYWGKLFWKETGK